MKSLIAVVFVSALFFGIVISPVHAEVCGGYTKAETDDSEVALAANFAMKAREKALRKTDKDALVSLVEILEAGKQVVAGMNYRMRLKVNINYKDQIVEVVVYKNLLDEYSLSSWTPVPAKENKP